jgi:hypothetical protein
MDKCTFEEDLMRLKGKLASAKYAKRVYAAMCNVEWVNVDQAPYNWREVLDRALKDYGWEHNQPWRTLLVRFTRWLRPKIPSKFARLRTAILRLDFWYGCGAQYPNFPWIYSCSWRYAGGVVADIRDVGEDYINFYCSGNEGHVDAEVLDDLSNFGWIPLEDIEYEENDE